jgi:hypothetical protein
LQPLTHPALPARRRYIAPVVAANAVVIAALFWYFLRR